jgi:hypothetical protein
VIQWKVTCDLSTLWQRFGRAGRNKAVNATATLIAEPKYFDDAKASRLEQNEKRKRRSEGKLESSKPMKKICLTKSEPTPKNERSTPILEALTSAPPSVDKVDMEGLERATSALYN